MSVITSIASTTIVVQGSSSCVTVPGWSVVILAALLTAPRLVKELPR